MENPSLGADESKSTYKTMDVSSASTAAASPSKSDSRPGVTRPLIWLVLGVGWMAPMVALLVLNFKGYILGASVGCAVRSCNDNAWSGDWGKTTEKLDLEDHNINGALQLVAKTLEIWFIFLAGGLIFDLTMWLAGTHDLPLRYLVLPTEFGELKSFLLSTTMWTCPRPAQPSATQAASQKKRILYIFVVFTLIVCIICNLMGPAAAVLLLPTLTWKEIPKPGKQVVSSIGISSAPTPSDLLSSCTSSDLSTGSYSCVEEAMENVLEMILNRQYSGQQRWQVLNQQGFLSFSFNLSGGYTGVSKFPLTPSRQTVESMSLDFNEWSFSGEDSNYTEAASDSLPEHLTPSLYKRLRNAQHVLLQRQEPGYRFFTDCTSNLHPTSTIQLSSDMMVHCFDFIQSGLKAATGLANPYVFPNSSTDEGIPISTLCIRVGSGWGGKNDHSSFHLMNYSSSTPVNVNVYSSDKAVYLNTSTYECTKNGVASGTEACDWEGLFGAEAEPMWRNASANPLVTDGALSPSDQPVFVHPDWMLASWAVDKNGTISDINLGESSFMDILDGTWSPMIVNYIDENIGELIIAQQTITAQALSLIGHTLEDASAAMDTSISAQGPILEASIQVYVWSYGLPSRTSQLGVVIAIAGCIIVLLRIVVAFKTRTVARDTLDFIITALKQKPPGIFDHEDQVAKSVTNFWSMGPYAKQAAVRSGREALLPPDVVSDSSQGDDSGEYRVFYDVATKTVAKAQIEEKLVEEGYEALLTQYLRHTMSAFHSFPQAWVLWLMAGREGRRTFARQYVGQLAFEAGDVVNGVYTVLGRDGNAVVFGIMAQGAVEGRLVVRIGDERERLDASTGAWVAVVQAEGKGEAQHQEMAVVKNETFMWVRRAEGVVMPLERRLPRWLHEVASWWLLDDGTKWLAATAGKE
ncbi:hypothetical protein DV736_g3817, partial [Chaetothyriales sp. CBS 134916]